MKKSRSFGLELEVATSKSLYQVVSALQNAGIKAEAARYGSQVSYDTWKVQDDSSINGWEIVSPPLTDTKDLEVVCHVLRKELRVRSSKKTGLHIHHDVSDLSVSQLKNIYELFYKYERNAIHSITSPHRFNNIYCANLNSSHVNSIRKCETLEDFKFAIRSRYLTLNNRSYVKYGTIEFRGAQGTVEIDRILSWIELTSCLIETAIEKEEIKSLRSGRTNEEALEIMFEELSMNNESQKHYRKVQRYFSKLA